MIASKISRSYPVDYGGTDTEEQMQPYLSAKIAAEDGNPIGWHYLKHEYISSPVNKCHLNDTKDTR